MHLLAHLNETEPSVLLVTPVTSACLEDEMILTMELKGVIPYFS